MISYYTFSLSLEPITYFCSQYTLLGDVLLFISDQSPQSLKLKNVRRLFFHHTTCESTCNTLASSAANQGDNTVSVAQGGTTTLGATEQLLPPDRVFKRNIKYISFKYPIRSETYIKYYIVDSLIQQVNVQIHLNWWICMVIFTARRLSIYVITHHDTSITSRLLIFYLQFGFYVLFILCLHLFYIWFLICDDGVQSKWDDCIKKSMYYYFVVIWFVLTNFTNKLSH